MACAGLWAAGIHGAAGYAVPGQTPPVRYGNRAIHSQEGRRLWISASDGF